VSVIKLETGSKQYRLGLVGTNTLRGDITGWWYRMRGLPVLLKIINVLFFCTFVYH